ncbi:MAG: NAD(P)-dependent oxidoreductase, partial [Hyphomicrobium sp.]
MIIVDRALQQRKDARRPLRVGMLGAGFMGHGVALQIASAVPGMDLVAICNRHVGKARQAFEEAGQGDAVVLADSARALAEAIDAGRCAVTDNPLLLAEDPRIDIVLEVTGSI